MIGTVLSSALAAAAAAGFAGAAVAQSRDPYGLAALKPYDGAVHSPAPNDLAKMLGSEKSAPKAKPPPDGSPVITLHGFGGVMVGGAISR